MHRSPHRDRLRLCGASQPANRLGRGGATANREYFELGVKDFAHAESEYPGWLSRLLTHPVAGLERYEEMMHLLTTEKQAVKVYVEVKSL